MAEFFNDLSSGIKNFSVKHVNNKTWSSLGDFELPVSRSLNNIQGIHERLEVILETYTPKDFYKTFNHPER